MQALQNLLNLIVEHRDKPCPTIEEIMQATDLPRHRVWPFVGELSDRGLVDLEVRGDRRRLRIAGGRWTGWA